MKFLHWILEDKIDWNYLCLNPNAIYLLEQNLDKINWVYLLGNPNTIHLLEQNLDKINWLWLSGNESIFEEWNGIKYFALLHILMIFITSLITLIHVK